VDSHLTFHDELNKTTEFEVKLSVRQMMNIKPFIILGQDGCIFKQYILTKKGWTAPDCKKALQPKDEGQGVMISSFVSREFGYGMTFNWCSIG
jgi:hypothetical protein